MDCTSSTCLQTTMWSHVYLCIIATVQGKLRDDGSDEQPYQTAAYYS